MLCLDILGCSIYRLPSLFKLREMPKIGVYITHISILIILSGGVTSGLMGFKEYLEINEKDMVRIPRTDIYVEVEDFSLEYYLALHSDTGDLMRH
ncbi:cytochrome c biogenesis protein ResB [Candidatus Desantisbacteria bacterium]|nr:cytochrome c biogenesis protein ResB [Candidatus Desantisbacteria bacterium]